MGIVKIESVDDVPVGERVHAEQIGYAGVISTGRDEGLVGCWRKSGTALQNSISVVRFEASTIRGQYDSRPMFILKREKEQRLDRAFASLRILLS